ncbi:MAG: hypothetical protein KatS3mg082_2095 [Nitrospiraceae bacterium]|nr:MAG: hypothetical protein KatS3mg082_2095 [Nitrospiraceae bacterium]
MTQPHRPFKPTAVSKRMPVVFILSCIPTPIMVTQTLKGHHNADARSQ